MGFLDSLFGPTSLPSSPTSQQTQTSTPSIQPWAQPYISDYLNKAQSLIANQQTPELLGQSYVDAKNLQLPGGFASGASLAQAGGQGALSTAPIALGYGQRGAEYGQQGTKYGEMGSAMGQVAARAGDLYAQQATSPQAMQAYMSPYMQDVVDYQKQQAIRDFAKQTPALQAQAVGQGAYGGSRQAIVQAEANRALNSQLQGIEALGRQQAFQQAQQAQQFGANLGLQGQQVGMQGQQLGLAGLGTAMQGQQLGLAGVGGAQAGYAGATQAGGTLGNIAAQEAQARLAALQLKNQFGMQQQMWPYQQLQFQQGLMQNLPFTSTTTTGQGYQSGPSPVSQIGGTVLGAYGLYKMLGMKAGGKVKGYADGGDVNTVPVEMGGPPPGAVWSETQGQWVQPGPNSGAMPGSMPIGSVQPMGAGIAGLMPTTTPMQDNSAYVNSLYSNMLGRQADQSGFQHNLNLLNSGKINQQDLANAFMASKEYQGLPTRNYLMGTNTGSGLSDIRLKQLLG